VRILDYYPISNKRENGAMTHMLSIADAFGSLGHKVLLVTYRPYRKVTGRFRMVPMPARPFGTARYGIGRICRKALLTALVRLWKPDCIYNRFSDGVAAEVAYRNGVARVCENARTPAGLKKLLSDSATRAEVLRPGGFVVVQPDTRSFLVSELGLQDETVVYLPSGFDPVAVGYARRSTCQSNAFVVGAILGSVEYFDLETFLAGFMLVRMRTDKIGLSILCDSPRAELVLSKAREAGLPLSSLHLPGQVPYHKLGSYYCSVDLAVLPFRKFWLEKAGTGGCESTRFAEYLGAGLCTVATDLPGTSTYALAQEGLFVAVPPEDPDSLAEALVELYRNPSKRERIAQAGQRYAFANRTWKRIAEQTVELMERVMHKPPDTKTAISIS
jgi:glycosyltransferase involved in cell wall biosynthesis